MPNYYEILGIEPNASDEDIKKAYRNLAREFHPDVNKEPDSEEKMKTISQAYGILSDPEKRKQYDLSQFNRMPPFPGFENFTNFNGMPFHFEIKYTNTSIQVVVPYQLKELLSPKTTTISFKRRKTCPKCKNLSPCTECMQGFLYEDVTKEITLPAGINAGQFVLEGEGNQEYLDNPPGHVVIKPYVEINEQCQVMNGDLVINREIDPVLLFIGGELTINTPLDEEITLPVQPNSYMSNAKKVIEKGLPLMMGNRDRRGALVVVLHPKFSENLTDEQMSILKSYLESRNR